MKSFTIAFLLFSGISFAQDEPSVELLFAGEFPGPGPYPESGEGWLAARNDAGALSLVETAIEVTEISSSCTGTATRITALEVDEPLFLVRGSSRFQSGPLETVFDEPRFIYPAEALSLRLGSGNYFGVSAYGAAEAEEGGTVVHDYALVLQRGMRTQRIAEFSRIGLDGPPRLIWAGDLDQDGYADALFDLARSYAGNLYVLFVSSAAPTGQLVERVAEFPVSGC